MTWVLENLGMIWELTVEHLRQSALPIVFAFILSVPLGWLAWRYTAMRGITLTVVSLLYTIPSLGLFALLSAVFGINLVSQGELNLIIALTIYGVAILTRSVTDGLDAVDPVVRSSAIAVGYGPWRRFWAVDFPLAGPVILAGLRVTATSTISLATVGVLIGVQNLGYLFTNGYQRRIIAEVFAGVVTVALIAIIIDVLLVLLGRLLMPWQPRRTRRAARPRHAAATEAVTA